MFTRHPAPPSSRSASDRARIARLAPPPPVRGKRAVADLVSAAARRRWRERIGAPSCRIPDKAAMLRVRPVCHQTPLLRPFQERRGVEGVTPESGSPLVRRRLCEAMPLISNA